MNRKVKILLACASTVALTALLVSILGYLVRPKDTDACISAVDAFHSVPENSLEVIAYGSSHIWKGLDTMAMYEAQGIAGYNYGCNWQRFNTTLLYMRDSFRTQKPRVAIVETYLVGSVLQDVDMTGEIYYSRAVPDFSGRREYLRQCFGSDPERYLSYYVPLAAFHENWVNLSKESFRSYVKEATAFFRDHMGFLPQDWSEPIVLPDPAAFRQQPLEPTSLEILDQMVSLCRENGTELLFVNIPWEGEFAYSEALSQYAEENGCAYLDLYTLTEEIGLDGQTDFADIGHLNASGGRKVGFFLADYLREHYDLTDFREVSQHLWLR